MKINLLDDGQAAPEEAVLALETATGSRLSSSYRSFLQLHDGAKPESNILRIDDKNAVGISRFIPVEQITEEGHYIENIPKRAYPVAWASGGNYIFIDEDKKGAVFFWDHEEPEKMVELAPTFEAFLDRLEPFDVRSVELKPGQVKRVWVDPEFLKRIKK